MAQCDHCAAIYWHICHIFWRKKRNAGEKSGDEWKKERLRMYASLCGGGDSLKAQRLVAHYLADSIFYSTNDKGQQPVCDLKDVLS